MITRFTGELCGICKCSYDTEPEATTEWAWWPNPSSSGAHPKCIELIKNVDQKLCSVLSKYFDNYERNMIHKDVIELVAEKLSGKNIKQFLEDEGVEKLETIFECASVAVVFVAGQRLHIKIDETFVKQVLFKD